MPHASSDEPTTIDEFPKVGGPGQGADLPPSSDDVDARFGYLRALDPNWDSYGALPMQAGVEERARAVIATLRSAPFICMTGNGGVSLEWNEEISIEVEPEGRISAVIQDRYLIEDMT